MLAPMDTSRSCLDVSRRLSSGSDVSVSAKSDPMASFNQEVLEEAGSDYEPAYEELVEYGRWLGIIPIEDGGLLWIAKEGLAASLPEGWKPCRTGDGQVYYFNFTTGASDWDHPCDAVFRAKVVAERAKLNGSGGTDTSAVDTGDTTGHSSFHSVVVSVDIKDVSIKSHDRSFPSASPVPPSRKGTPSPRPVGPVSRGFTRTPLRPVDGNLSNVSDFKSAAKRTTLSAHSKRGQFSKVQQKKTHDENENVLNFSGLSSTSMDSNVSSQSSKRGRLAMLPVKKSLGSIQNDAGGIGAKQVLGKDKPVLGAAKGKSPKSKKLNAITKCAELQVLKDTSVENDEHDSSHEHKSYPSMILDDEELSVEVLDTVPIANRNVKTSARESDTESSSSLRVALATAEAETKAAVTALKRAEIARDAATKARSEAESALEKAQSMLEKAAANTQVSKQETEAAKVTTRDAETRARQFEREAETATQRAAALEASSFKVRQELDEVTKALEVAGTVREKHTGGQLVSTQKSGPSEQRCIADSIAQATEALTIVFRNGFEDQKNVWTSERERLQTMAQDLVLRAERAATTAKEAARVAERLVARGASKPSVDVRKTHTNRSTSPRSTTVSRPPLSPRSSDTPAALGTALQHIAERATSASASPNNSNNSMDSLTDVSASSDSVEPLSFDVSRPASPASDAEGDYSGGRIGIRGRNLKAQPPSNEPSPLNSPRTRSPRNAFKSNYSNKASSSHKSWKTTEHVGTLNLKPWLNPEARNPKATSPASLAAFEAEKSCSNLVKRLESLRVAGTVAKRKGWSFGDERSQKKREADMEDWLARERSSLRSFKMVAALLG